MAHFIGTEGFLYKLRHRKIRSRSAWSFLEFICSRSLSHLFNPSLLVQVLTWLSGLASEATSVRLYNCPREFQTTAFTHSLWEQLKDLRAHLSRTLPYQIVSRSTCTHTYIHPIQIADSSFIAYAHLSGSITISIHESFSFFVMLSVSIPNYH